MSREHREWTDRFSAYLADELGAAERADLEAHLAECGTCRDVLAGLRDLVARAAALDDLEPPRDLWPGIAAAIGGPAPGLTRPGDPSVIRLPTADADRWRSTVGPTPAVRRARLGAAAAALVVVSVGSTWWVATSRIGPSEGTAASAAAVGETLRAIDTGAPPPDLAGDLAALEEVLQVARGSLDATTVRVLERNLAVIEQAIADSREALLLDPGNTFLVEHLERMYRRKLVYLQDVVRVVQWSG